MDAVHLARGLAGPDRQVILKVEGSYPCHHDAVMVSVKPPAELMGERGTRARSPTDSATPPALPSTRARSPSTTPARSRGCSTSSRAGWPA